MMSGFGRLNYGKLPGADAASAYRLRREIVRIGNELEESMNEVRRDMQGADDGAAKMKDMMLQMGADTREIAVRPVAFDSWRLLLQDNPFLAGWEEILEDFIEQPKDVEV